MLEKFYPAEQIIKAGFGSLGKFEYVNNVLKISFNGLQVEHRMCMDDREASRVAMHAVARTRNEVMLRLAHPGFWMIDNDAKTVVEFHRLGLVGCALARCSRGLG